MSVILLVDGVPKALPGPHDEPRAPWWLIILIGLAIGNMLGLAHWALSLLLH